MTVEQEIELQEHVKKHQASLGCDEMKRKSRLLNQAQKLINKLIRRALTFKRVDAEQTHRSLRALSRATDRAERRARAYYGG
jgi:hypothetical protein